MRKKVLFIIGCLDSGGVAKSLVTLMNVIDKKKYDIHLLILSAVQGPFVQYLPNDITIHRDERIAGLVDGKAGLKPLVQKGHIWLAICSLFRMCLSRFDRGYAGLLLAKLMPRLDLGEFDTVEDYGGQHLLYYMADKVLGKKKISYFHNDYSKWDYYFKVDKKYLRKVDRIVVITEICKQSMISYFPEQIDKMCVIENIVSPKILWQQAEMDFPEVDFFRRNFVLITVGHVCHRKGFDFALEAASLLRKRGRTFKWVFIGSYGENHLRQVIDAGLEDTLLFYGIRPNPYPYIAQSQVLVHPARFESQALVVSEARLLCKPIVVTRFSTVKDILIEGANASVCEMNAESLADKIDELIQNDSLREKYIEYHKNHIVDNSGEVQKLYSIFEQ